MNTKVKILASALLGGFGTASATTASGGEPVLPPSTMKANGKTYYIQSASEATGGGGTVICGPYADDPTASVFLCVNRDTQIGFAGVINTEKVERGSYLFAANNLVLLLIIAGGGYSLYGLRKKNKILEKKAKAYDQLQDLAEGLKTHYPLSSGE